MSLATDLGIDGAQLLEPFFEGLFQLLTGVKLLGEVSPAQRQELWPWAELMSTTLGAAFLEQQGALITWLDARKDLRLDENVLTLNRNGIYLLPAIILRIHYGFIPWRKRTR